MAEGWAKALLGDRIEPFSAGIEKHGLNSRAVTVMQEAGVDITAHRSKTLDDLESLQFDLVVTVCGHADENCPAFPAPVPKIHVPFDDPPKLARFANSEEEALVHYRRVRDEIRDFVLRLPNELG
jgi:arsenate reductase